MNNLTIAGNLGRDARLRHVDTQNGQVAVTNFAVAVQRRQKDKDGKPLTLWVDCALWGKRAEALQPYLTKGLKVAVAGEANVEQFQRQDGSYGAKLTCRVNEVTLQGGGQGQQAQSQQPNAQAQAQTPPQQPPANGPAFPAESSGMDDIPF